MDAAAYLTNQGWRGDGHALHHSGKGITKPIHISQKADVLGVGKKQHDAHANQWWARAFDDTLKGLNTAKDEATGNTDGVLVDPGAQALQMLGIGGAKLVGQPGLYSNFVRGESLSGTLTPEGGDHSETQTQSEDQKKQKRGSNDAELFAAVAKDVKRSKRNRRLHAGDGPERPKLVGVGAVQQDTKNVGRKQDYEKQRARPKIPETNEERRQRKREKRARKALGANEGNVLPEQSRTNAVNDVLRPTDKPRENCTQLGMQVS